MNNLVAAATVVVHAAHCLEALDECTVCRTLSERDTGGNRDRRGILDVAIDDLAAQLPSVQ